MITRLQVQDFKRHENLDLSFPTGLSLIQGNNFTGKSSVLHAILYALWGPSAVPGGAAVVARTGASKATVELDFTLHDSEFKVTRSGSSVTVSKDGAVVAKSASVVAGYLEDLLGLSKERFLQLKVSTQKETESLLTLGVTKLHAIIEEISGASVVTEVVSRALTASHQAKGGLEAMPQSAMSEATDTEQSLRGYLNTLSTTMKTVESGLTGATERLAGASKVVLDARKANVKAHEAQQEHSRMLSEEARWVEIRDSTNVKLEGIEDSEYTLEEAQKERDQAVTYAAQVEAEARQRAAREKTIKTLTARRDKTQELVGKSEAGLVNAPTRVDPTPYQEAHNKASVVFQARKQERVRILAALKDGICPTCMRPFEGYDQEGLEAQRREIEASIPAAASAQELTGRTLREVSVNNQLRQEIEARLESDRQILAHQSADLLDAMEFPIREGYLVVDPEGPKRAADKWAVVCDDIQKSRFELNGLRTSLEQACNKLDEVRASLDTHGEPPAQVDISELVAAEKHEQNLYSELLGRVQYNQGLYKGKYAEWEAAELSLTQAKELEVKRGLLEKRSAGIDDFVKYLRKNRDRFLSDIWLGLTSYAGNFASACTDGAIESLMRNDNGSFSYLEDGIERPITAASGAQRSIMGLGVQLALATMLPSPLSSLLLDEPTADLDPERSLAMASLLSAESGQVLMVSHRSFDSAVAAEVFDMGEAA